MITGFTTVSETLQSLPPSASSEQIQQVLNSIIDQINQINSSLQFITQDNQMFKIVDTGTMSVTVTNYNTDVSVNHTHGLGYTPTVFIFEEVDGVSYPFSPGTAGLGVDAGVTAASWVEKGALITTNDLTIHYAWKRNGTGTGSIGSPSTYNLRYYICRETAN